MRNSSWLAAINKFNIHIQVMITEKVWIMITTLMKDLRIDLRSHINIIIIFYFYYCTNIVGFWGFGVLGRR